MRPLWLTDLPEEDDWWRDEPIDDEVDFEDGE